MALSAFLQGSRKFPALSFAASKLIQTQMKNCNLILTPLIARQFSGLNGSVLTTKKLYANNTQLGQTRPMSHSIIWTAEKLLSLALLGIIPACVAFPSQITDNILAVSLVLHMHWGVEAVVLDYIRPSLVGKIIPSIAKIFVYLLSAFTLAGLIYFNTNDIGLGKAVRRMWAIKPNDN